MGLLLSFANGYGRLYDPKNSIILAGAVMVWFNPYILVFDVGFQLSFSKAVVLLQGGPLMWGLGYKLLLAPLLMILLFVGALGSHSLSTQITILEAVMAPMITASVVAIEFGLNSEIASLMVGIGIPLSLLTVPLWYRLLEIIL